MEKAVSRDKYDETSLKGNETNNDNNKESDSEEEEENEVKIDECEIKEEPLLSDGESTQDVKKEDLSLGK